MVKLTIDGAAVTAREGETILAAAKRAGIAIPTLCHLEGLNEIGACRVCVVEVAGLDRLVAACTTPVEEGVIVLTNSPKVRRARKVNVDLLLSRHDCQCLACGRNGNCALQNLAGSLGVMGRVYKTETIRADWDASFPLIRHMGK
jgi:NADH-quinone oxidoreductase subunit G